MAEMKEMMKIFAEMMSKQHDPVLLVHSRGNTGVHAKGIMKDPKGTFKPERFVQTFERSMAKSTLPTEAALREFLMQYRRTPFSTGLLVHICLHDILRPILKGKEREENYNKVKCSILISQPCYVKYYGPRRDRQASWVPAIVVRRLDRQARRAPAIVVRRLSRRHILVKSISHGLLWKRHVEQIRPRYGANQDGDPGEITGTQSQFDSRHSIVKPTTPESSQVLFDPISLPRRSERIRHKFAHKL
ncbi:hypothetical protein HELRODRAFT_175905 [Helobdella robusta]|uniref:Uncharacterized protein n=1 Tax=Helobdella robusta TaxID=6412 RepID=T1F9V1_HELRO|nr:hypothetical protein HELRODRAFT_175905 [Helobdella robusta]ESO00466.1 hypothetical protein HELRODRAFT_175905 [Helobdella robusta]